MYLLLFSLFLTLAFSRAPLKTAFHPERIDGQYIVMFYPTVDDVLQQKHQAMFGKSVFASYNMTRDFMGYAASLTDDQLETVLNDPIVKEVHYDHLVHMYDRQQTCDTTQVNVKSWGICRVSQYGPTKSELQNTYKWNSGQAGTEVHIHIIDTGIMTNHIEFETRATWGSNHVNKIDTDENGHGTHCAGTAAGVSVGLARNSQLVAVKVLDKDGSGTLSGVVAGMNWVANQYTENKVPAVASMSLGGGKSDLLNEAAENLVEAGVTIVVAAGNSAYDACFFSPSSSPSVISVGSSSLDPNFRDIRSSFSNYGNCVHIYAPGSSIVSCGISATNSFVTMSGTSMACPHVAGVAAMILHQNPHFTPAEVKAAVLNTGNKGQLANPDTASNNILAYSGC
jgi:subtilisin family serine protease